MRLLVFLPQVNPTTFLLFTWNSETGGACLRDYSRGPDFEPTEARTSTATRIRELLADPEAMQFPAEHRPTTDTQYWFAETNHLNQQHGLLGWIGEAQDVAERGSQYWIQRYVNEQPQMLQDAIVCQSPSLTAFTPTAIHWKSPRAQENYREYRDGFLKALGLADYVRQRQEFWPNRGPQWDALATVVNEAGERGVLLLEAKAYPSEALGDGTEAGGEARGHIIRSLDAVKAHCGVPLETDWLGTVYQTANRVAFLYFLNQVCQVPTWLVLVNFVNDSTHHPTSMAQWSEHYLRLYRQIGFQRGSKLFDRIVTVFPDVLQWQAA